MKDYSLRNEKSRLIQALATSLHEHITELFDNGYDQGYADAKSELGQNAIDLAHEESDRAYQQGLEDAWEAARKIASAEGLSMHVLAQIFDTASFSRILNENTASEAISKIKEYEEQQKQDTEIKVGDEVNHQGLKSVVVRIADDCIYTISECGTTPKYYKDDNLVKTGRHFDQISEVLEKMRGEE